MAVRLPGRDVPPACPPNLRGRSGEDVRYDSGVWVRVAGGGPGEGEQAGLGLGEDAAGDEAFEFGAQAFGVLRGGAGTERVADVFGAELSGRWWRTRRESAGRRDWPRWRRCGRPAVVVPARRSRVLRVVAGPASSASTTTSCSVSAAIWARSCSAWAPATVSRVVISSRTWSWFIRWGSSVVLHPLSGDGWRQVGVVVPVSPRHAAAVLASTTAPRSPRSVLVRGPRWPSSCRGTPIPMRDDQ